MKQSNNHFPILMYHAISAGGSVPETSSLEHAVTASDFRDQLDAIVSGGYHTITLDDLELPFSAPRPTLITFDDGHESDFTIAAPDLAKRNLHAIFFVIWSYLGQPGYLTRDQVVELRRDGFEIGSHGMTHSRLTQITPAEASNEVLESKRRLEDLLQEPIAGLALPFGHYNDAVLHAAWAAGYRRVMTSDFKVANREHRIMPRMGPMAYHSLKDFKWMLEATPAAAIRHRKIEAIGERLRRFVNIGEALLMRAQNSAPTKN
jgi:peptidoglycan/xylan/chitin deacetylase (PgdA/CDA1 family)